MKKEEKKFYANKLLERYIKETKNNLVKKAISKGFSKEQAEFLWDEFV